MSDLKPAMTKTEARRHLGLFGYFRDHIPGYAELANLTSKHVPNIVPWNEEHTAALSQLKQTLSVATDRMLYVGLADFEGPLRDHIRVDASDAAVAGYISQPDGDGTDCPLAFFSVKLSGQQKSWTSVHKEAFAVIAALKKYLNWIFGSPVHIYSDHNPLTFLTQSAPQSAKLMRWVLALQEFDIKFHYVKGALNTAPDRLSQLPFEH